MKKKAQKETSGGPCCVSQVQLTITGRLEPDRVCYLPRKRHIRVSIFNLESNHRYH